MSEPSDETVQPPIGQPSPPRRSALETVAYVAVIVGVIAFLGNTVREYVSAAEAAAAEAVGDTNANKMLTHSVTNALAASTTFTNMGGFTMHSCFKGVVTNKTSREKAESMVVCSGDVKPHTSVTVAAPYDPGRVAALCERSPGSGLDWDQCEFTTVEMK